MSDNSEKLSIELEGASVESPSTTGGNVTPRPAQTKVKPKNYLLDLRIHSPVSLGYLAIEGIDTAPAMVRLAKTKGLDVIAVTDFYSGAYIDRIKEAAALSNLTVIPGVHIRCAIKGCDDVHLSCLFPINFGTTEVEKFVEDLGVPVSQRGNKEFLVKRDFAAILELVESRGGVALPSRMDKTPYRMNAIPTLVTEWGFRTFDLAYGESNKFFKTRWPKLKFNLFSFSNANALAQVGSRIAKVKLDTPSFEAIREMVARTA